MTINKIIRILACILLAGWPTVTMAQTPPGGAVGVPPSITEQMGSKMQRGPAAHLSPEMRWEKKDPAFPGQRPPDSDVGQSAPAPERGTLLRPRLLEGQGNPTGDGLRRWEGGGWGTPGDGLRRWPAQVEKTAEESAGTAGRFLKSR